MVVEGHTVGHITGFTFHPDPLAAAAEKRLVQRAARRALGQEMPRRVALLYDASDAAFAVREDQTIAWDGTPIARLRPGSGLTKPLIEVGDSEFLDGASACGFGWPRIWTGWSRGTWRRYSAPSRRRGTMRRCAARCICCWKPVVLCRAQPSPPLRRRCAAG